MNTLPDPSYGVEHPRTPQEPAKGRLVTIPVPDGFDLGDLPQLHPFFDGDRLRHYAEISKKRGRS